MWHSCSNLSTSYGSRLRHVHGAQVWVVSCVLYSWAVTALEFLLVSPGFNSFPLFRDGQNSKCVWGGVVAVIKCIDLPQTYLHFMQYIEDRCLLLTSSTSFVDLIFQKHRMTWPIFQKHHMGQNPYISSLCPKPGVVSDNMTWGDDMAKSPSPTEPQIWVLRWEGGGKGGDSASLVFPVPNSSPTLWRGLPAGGGYSWWMQTEAP
jgi:hypothetical protein